MFAMGLLKNFIFILLIALPQNIVFNANADEQPPPANPTESATEDALEDEEATVESDEKPEPAPTGVVADTEQEEESNTIDGLPKPHPDAEAILLFTQPALGVRSSGNGVELPAGQPINVMIGFTHKGKDDAENNEKDFTLVSVDAAIRYPQDYSFYLQNFTSSRVSRTIEPQREASLAYSFTPALQLAGRPFGLTVRVHYQDVEGKSYVNAVFNDTIQVVELDEGFDTESFFLWVLIVAVLVIFSVGGYHLFSTYGKIKLPRRQQKPMEMGTTVNNDVDYDWIPKQHMELQQKRKSPSVSPRQRKTKRTDEKNRGSD